MQRAECNERVAKQLRSSGANVSCAFQHDEAVICCISYDKIIYTNLAWSEKRLFRYELCLCACADVFVCIVVAHFFFHIIFNLRQFFHYANFKSGCEYTINF